MQDLGGKTLLFAQQAEQQMLRPDMFVIQALGLFGAIGQNAFALVAQWKVDRSGNLFADGGVRFNLLANGFNGRVGAQKPVGQRLVLAQQPQQQVLRLYVRAPKLASLISGKEDDSARLFGITFKHDYRRLSTLSVVPAPDDRVETRRRSRGSRLPFPVAEYGGSGWRRRGCA